ncbi:hypothetical protein DPEC_G00004750 [Dallia pectoralis]|uniref:Uncharacterized protein n=1 Tax=Dallia pectoralis TaxID=75939 RepID=A0ACC2HJZ5_DALPE|nr:hypothetical protein DPEC_G00004750 [Dallia pectoralis]
MLGQKQAAPALLRRPGLRHTLRRACLLISPSAREHRQALNAPWLSAMVRKGLSKSFIVLRLQRPASHSWRSASRLSLPSLTWEYIIALQTHYSVQLLLDSQSECSRPHCAADNKPGRNAA